MGRKGMEHSTWTFKRWRGHGHRALVWTSCLDRTMRSDCMNCMSCRKTTLEQHWTEIVWSRTRTLITANPIVSFADDSTAVQCSVLSCTTAAKDGVQCRSSQRKRGRDSHMWANKKRKENYACFERTIFANMYLQQFWCERMLRISALSCEHALQHFCIAMHVAHFPPMLRCFGSKRSTVEVTQRQTSCSAYAIFKIESETRIVWWRAARS